MIQNSSKVESEDPIRQVLENLVDADLVLRLKEFAQHPVHRVPAYIFTMIHRYSGEELGRISLRVHSTPHVVLYAGHIGYTVLPEHRGHHYAARSVRLLSQLARALNMPTLWITCDPENAASRRTLELAGAEFVETVDVPPNCVIFQHGHPRKCRYRLHVAETQAAAC